MAPILFEELNVFTFPHSRMKKLMDCCTIKVGHTDFTSLNEFEDLLKGLERILFELMAHEEIENQFVMKKLKVKLKEDRTLEQNDLICNCHKEDRFTPLQNLFRDGYAFIRRGNADRISYQIKLHKVIKQFYEDFLPHMHEEENDIQPLLSKYFTEIELKIMRIEVIRMTLKKRKNCSKSYQNSIERPLIVYVVSINRNESMNYFSDEIFEHIFHYLTDEQIHRSCLTVNKQWNHCASKVLRTRSPINRIPNEILLRIFKYHLNPVDLLSSCLQVNRKWKKLIEDKSMWKTVNPINWAKNQWNSNVPQENNLIDEDLVDNQIKNEQRILDGFQKYFLPNYSISIENLILYGSLTLNDNLARKIFNLCPNLKYLNVGMTKITSKSFLQYRWINRLEILNVEGCDLIDDDLFVNICSSMEFIENSSKESIEENYRCSFEEEISHLNSRERFLFCCQCSTHLKRIAKNFQLKSLSLSGCQRLTDFGLKYFLLNGCGKQLEMIDLSGCYRLTGEMIQSLIDECPKLKSESIFCCDNLDLSSTSNLSNVNCCRNVENPNGNFCCRKIFSS